MKFGYTILYVDDVEAALTFYERAFGLMRRMMVDSYGELSTGETTLAFAARTFAATHYTTPIQPGGPLLPTPPMEIALIADDVQGAFDQAIAAGAVAIESPAQKPWGQTVAYVRDNNGFMIELCSAMG